MSLENRQLATLLDVHHFYMGLLRDQLQHDVPLPYGLERLNGVSAENVPEDDVEETALLLRRWLNVMDMAITAPMVRDALKTSTSHQTAASLLLYFVNKVRHTDTDRDKTDFVVTFLYRNPFQPGAWDASGDTFSATDSPSQFETTLLYILDTLQAPPLPDEHRHLVRELNFIAEEVDEFRHFDALMDSGLNQRVREMKQSLGASFYHPHALAVVAAYNVFFGQRFDKLFHEAAKQIKTFAERIQAEGGSISSRVQGDVTVKELAAVEEGKLLNTEYGKAQEQFRKVSKLKKAVDNRRGRHATVVAEPASTVPTIAPDPLFSPVAHPLSAVNSTEHGVETLTSAASMPSGGALTSTLEDAKLKAMEDIIRNFLKAADTKGGQMVPLRHGNLALSPQEADAFRVEYGAEKSFRADYAQCVISLVTVQGRILTETAEYRGKQNSAYLWKPHADSLAYLVKVAQKAVERAQEVSRVAEQRGLAEKVNALNGTSLRVREHLQKVAKLLQSVGAAANSD